MHRIIRGRAHRLTLLSALLAAVALLLTACPEDDPDVADDPDEEEPGDPGVDTVTFGMVEWAENIANTALWEEILEEQGYETEREVLDPGAVFAGVAAGDLDLFLDMWLPVTHEDYLEEFGDDFEDLGIWFEGDAGLNMTVPAYVEGVDEIGDLVGEGDRFDSTIVGIDPGSGLARTTNEEVMPGYGLDEDGWDHVESSEPAMLTELEGAIENEEDIVVTLWTPHWAYAEWDLRVLEDPEGLYGDVEELHAIARGDLRDEDEELVCWIENFLMTEEELGSLSGAVEEAEDTEAQREVASEWIEDNRDVVDGWLEC